MKIAIIPSSQLTSVGSGILPGHFEAELMRDFSARLVPKLRAAGHTVEQFIGRTEVGSDGAYAAVAWRPQICIDLHLDSAGGAPAALLCYQEQRSLAMGLKILAVYCQAMGIRNKGGMKRIPGVSGVAVIRIPEASGIPTALIECGDMDAPDGRNWVEPTFREHAARCMATAICSYAGGIIPTPQKPQEDDDMIIASLGHPALVPSFATDSMKCYLDFSNQANTVTKIRLSARRDTGDRTDPGWSAMWTKDILEEGTMRIEVGKDLKLLQGVTVKVEVLAGGPVLVTRKQTL